MSYFPFFVNLQGKQCLVVGGGSVAYRKVCALLPFGVQIKVVAPDICPALSKLAQQSAGGREKTDVSEEENMSEREQTTGGISLSPRKYLEADLEGVFFVIAATDDARCNREIACMCQERNILVNVVDEPEQCSFYFPSLMKRGDLVAGICSGGKSPVLSKQVKNILEQEIPEFYGQLNDNLGQVRSYVRENLHTEAQRKQCYEAMIHQSREEKRVPSPLEMREIAATYIPEDCLRETDYD